MPSWTLKREAATRARFVWWYLPHCLGSTHLVPVSLHTRSALRSMPHGKAHPCGTALCGLCLHLCAIVAYTTSFALFLSQISQRRLWAGDPEGERETVTATWTGGDSNIISRKTTNSTAEPVIASEAISPSLAILFLVARLVLLVAMTVPFWNTVQDWRRDLSRHDCRVSLVVIGVLGLVTEGAYMLAEGPSLWSRAATDQQGDNRVYVVAASLTAIGLCLLQGLCVRSALCMRPAAMSSPTPPPGGKPLQARDWPADYGATKRVGADTHSANAAPDATSLRHTHSASSFHDVAQRLQLEAWICSRGAQAESRRCTGHGGPAARMESRRARWSEGGCRDERTARMESRRARWSEGGCRDERTARMESRRARWSEGGCRDERTAVRIHSGSEALVSTAANTATPTVTNQTRKMQARKALEGRINPVNKLYAGRWTSTPARGEGLLCPPLISPDASLEADDVFSAGGFGVKVNERPKRQLTINNDIFSSLSKGCNPYHAQVGTQSLYSQLDRIRPPLHCGDPDDRLLGKNSHRISQLKGHEEDRVEQRFVNRPKGADNLDDGGAFANSRLVQSKEITNMHNSDGCGISGHCTTHDNNSYKRPN